MSRTTCFNIRSGSSAFSTRSFRFALNSVLTLSSNDIIPPRFRIQNPPEPPRNNCPVVDLLVLRCRLRSTGLGRRSNRRHLLHHFLRQHPASFCHLPHHQRHVLL